MASQSGDLVSMYVLSVDRQQQYIHRGNITAKILAIVLSNLTRISRTFLSLYTQPHLTASFAFARKFADESARLCCLYTFLFSVGPTRILFWSFRIFHSQFLKNFFLNLD